MNRTPDIYQLNALENLLDIESTIPRKSNAENRLISYSHIFRDKNKAVEFARNIRLGAGESLTGGYTIDSIGRLWWLGVQLDSFEQWQNNGGYHRAAMQDPEIPGNQML